MAGHLLSRSKPLSCRASFHQLIHKQEFDKYIDKLPEIIKEPTYVGVHPKQGGIEFIKEYKENVLVAVRASKNDVLYVRSIYFITKSKIDKYLEEGTIKKIKP